MSIFQRLFFNLWYYRRPPWDSGISPPELMAFIASHPPGKALDLGCGTGTNVITLAQHAWEVTGVDFARHAIQIAREKIRRAKVKAEVHFGDVTNLTNLPGSYDLILDIGCFHNLPRAGRQVYTDNLKHMLAPGGTFLIYGFINPSNRAGRGITEIDLQSFSSCLILISRRDGKDRGGWNSAWLEYQQPPVDASTRSDTGIKRY